MPKFETPSAPKIPRPEFFGRPAPTEAEMFADPSAAEWVSRPTIEVAQDTPETCESMIAEFETLMTSFETGHDFDALRAITRFETREERKASIRARALEDIAPTENLLRRLEKQDGISELVFTELRARLRTIQCEVLGSLRDDPSGKGEIVIHQTYEEGLR